MKRALKLLSVGLGILLVCGLTVILFVAYLFWPDDEWDCRLSSPDGRYDVLVLRSSMAAFDSFSYHLYVLPHALAPRDQVKGAYFARSPFWRRRDKHLVYSGYRVPTFRWSGPRELTVNLSVHEWNDGGEFITSERIKRLSDSDEPICISVNLIAQHDPRDTIP